MRAIFITVLLLTSMGQESSAAESGVIVLYHHVATNTPSSTSISPEGFRAHLEYLRDNQFNVVRLDTLIETLKNQRQLPDRTISITFDDGYISIYEEAFPMLQSFGFPFALFVSTDPLNRNQTNYMNWEQVREISEAGALIANHMVDHPYMLNRLNGENQQQWLERQRMEILEAEETIERETSQSHRYLAYPYGEFNPAIKSMLEELDFIGLAQNSGAVGFNSDFQALPRYPLASIYASLGTARSKFDSKAFNVKLVRPASPEVSVRNPSVTLEFAPGNYNFSQIGCFANSEPIPLNWQDREAGLLELIPNQEYGGRRWRYICTAPDPGTSRYYWYSVQFINTGN